MNRKGNIYVIFFKSAKALFRKYEKSCQITRRLQSNDFLWNFSQKCSKNWMRYTPGKIIKCLRLIKKRYILLRISTKCQRFFWVISRSSRPEVFFKRGVLENFSKFTGNPLHWSLFLIKLQSSSLQLYSKKRDSSTGVILWILRNFQEHLQVAACFFTISREVSHYAFLSVGFFKGTSTDNPKKVFRKVLFMWSSMPSFSFIGYTLTELF